MVYSPYLTHLTRPKESTSINNWLYSISLATIITKSPLRKERKGAAMPIINDNYTITMNNEMLFELANCFGTSDFAETFTKVYERFRYRGATRLQWKALQNIFRDVFSKETKDVWRGILREMQKTCITFPSGISFLWNGDVVSDNGDYEGWVIEG